MSNFQAGVKKFLTTTITTITTTTLYHHHHSTITTDIKISCVAIYAVLCFVSEFTRFWCQIFELEMVLVSKNYKYEVF